MDSLRLNQRFAAIAAGFVGKESISKNQCRLVLNLMRMDARNIIARMEQARLEERRLGRYAKQVKGQGVLLLPVELAKEQARQDYSEARSRLIKNGEIVMRFLDLWQEKGATLLDLCHLCGHEHRRTLREIKKADLDGRFSALVFVHNLDYRNDRADWIDYDTDAPLTHAVKEYMMNVMLTTPEGRAASDQAFQEVFPEVWENRRYLSEDYEGNQVMVDKDGEIVGYAEGGNPT